MERPSALYGSDINLITRAKESKDDISQQFYFCLPSKVDNTDAEGRLILADAICYACKTYEPEVLIDLATLTGQYVL